MNNTLNHVSDSSVYVLFDPAGTQWPANVENVQQAISLIGSWARTDIGLPDASETQAGIAFKAAQSDVDAGTDDSKFITSLQLKTALSTPQATQTRYGFTRYSTDAESILITNDTTSLTPRAIDYVFKNRKATETIWGSAKLSTNPQALAGTDDTTAMTPLKVKNAVAALIPVQSDATEAAKGLVQLATVAQVRAGTIREGFAISPYTFIRLQATEANIGVAKVATQTEVNAGADDTKMVTAAKLGQLKGSASQFGIVKLVSTKSTAANSALSASANVLPSDKDAVMTSGDIYKTSVSETNKYQTYQDVLGAFPIGGIILTAFTGDTDIAMVCNGRSLSTTTYAALFSRIGYTFGGSGTSFNLPDMRGAVPRGFDNGKGLDSGRVFGSYQGDAIQNITGGFTVDDQSVSSDFPPSGAFYADGQGVNYDANSSGTRIGFKMHFDASRVVRTAQETRVKNVALNYVIRVK